MYDFCFIAVNDLETDARTLNLTRMLSKHGCKICIIALGNTDNNDSKSDNIDIFHINPSKAKRASVRILDFYSTLRKKYSNIESKYYIAEDLYSLPYASKLAKKFLGKLIYDSREIYSALGPLNGKSLKQYLLTKLEARYIKNVDGIIVSGELDAEHLKSIYNQDTPISVIKNLPSYKDRFESKILRNKFGIPVTSSILLYQGMILPGRGLKPIIAALPVIDKAVIYCMNTLVQLMSDLHLLNP
jgi:glycosyltransferase involved in cell wall biosynthesis